MGAPLMAFIEDSTPQNITARILSVGLFCGAGFYKRREKNCKEKKKYYILIILSIVSNTASNQRRIVKI